MANRTEDKHAVFRGIAAAWVLSILFIGTGYWLSAAQGWFAELTSPVLLALALILPGLSLIMGIGWAARTRHFGSHIDGSAPASGTSLDITLRYVQNTTEQLVLFFIMAVCLSGVLPHFAQSILPVLGLWFFIARLMFWAGYRRSPLSRAVGFAATFHPTIIFTLTAALALLIKLRGL